MRKAKNFKNQNRAIMDNILSLYEFKLGKYKVIKNTEDYTIEWIS